MRTGRERLIEWIEDILKYGDEDSPEGWADSIMHDINRGIIKPEVNDIYITIQHEGGNTITGTVEQVLNRGHLKPGWRAL